MIRNRRRAEELLIGFRAGIPPEAMSSLQREDVQELIMMEFLEKTNLLGGTKISKSKELLYYLRRNGPLKTRELTAAGLYTRILWSLERNGQIRRIQDNKWEAVDLVA